jgi:hypothetical protein
VCPTADHVVFLQISFLCWKKKLGFGPFHPNIAAAAAKPRGQIIISTTIFRLLARWIQFLGGKVVYPPSSNG